MRYPKISTGDQNYPLDKVYENREGFGTVADWVKGIVMIQFFSKEWISISSSFTL